MFAQYPTKPFQVWHWPLVIVTITLACSVGLYLLKLGGQSVSPIWPAAGVSVAIMVHFGKSAAPALLLGHLAMWGWIPPSATNWPILVMPFCYVLSAWWIAETGYHNARFKPSDASSLLLVAWSFLITPILCSIPLTVFAVTICTISGRYEAGQEVKTFIMILMTYVHGIVAFSGLTLHLLKRDFNFHVMRRERFGILAAFASISIMVLSFCGVFSNFLTNSSAIYLPFPFLIMAAVLLPPAPISLLVALWCVLSTLLSCVNIGPFTCDIATQDPKNHPVEIGLYNIVMASITYLTSVGASQLSRQLHLNEVTLNAAGIELWEWELNRGFTSTQNRRLGSYLKNLSNHLGNDLKILTILSNSDLAQDSWHTRILSDNAPSDAARPTVPLATAGRILRRALNGDPIQAIGMLQDLSPFEKAEKALIALGQQNAKLRSLQAKLDPHFLFNSLNVLRALIHIDTARADEALVSLASLLRSNLRANQEHLVELGEELQNIKSLLHLAELRFGTRLTVEVIIPDCLSKCLIPPMMLINLVENAITHGVAKMQSGSWIRVSALVTAANEISISIWNSGHLPSDYTSGIGTNDVHQRLELLYSGAASFTLSQESTSTVKANLIIPILNSQTKS